METLATLTIACGSLSLLSLLLLHFVSPEFQPSWRMISEYALGKHKWLITSFFLLWALSSAFLAILLWGQVSSGWAKFGVALLLLSAVGEAMGGLFDVKHKLHGAAFGLGIPTLPAGALFISYHLSGSEKWGDATSNMLLLAHCTWIGVILMALAMMLLFSGFKKAGVAMGPDIEASDTLPAGVIPLAGWANRLLVLVYVLWLVVTAQVYLNL